MIKTVLITGTNRGLGLEFVKQYAQDGWQVLACCRKPDAAKELQLVQKEFKETVQIFKLDITDFAAIDALADQLKNTPIDVLLSSAGTYGSHQNKFGTVDYNDWAETFRINTMAGLKLAEAFVNHVSNSQQKKMIFITSKMGSLSDNTSGKSYIYRSTKAALNAVVKSLSHDLKDKNIITAVLNPGWVKTDMGGPEAPTSPTESIKGMREVIENLNMEKSGHFFGFKGDEIPW